MPTLDDHLIALTSSMARVEARLGSLEKSLLGNGMPGLMQKVESLEEQRNKVVGAVSVVGVLGAGLWGFLEWLFHFSKSTGGSH